MAYRQSALITTWITVEDIFLPHLLSNERLSYNNSLTILGHIHLAHRNLVLARRMSNNVHIAYVILA